MINDHSSNYSAQTAQTPPMPLHCRGEARWRPLASNNNTVTRKRPLIYYIVSAVYRSDSFQLPVNDRLAGDSGGAVVEIIVADGAPYSIVADL